MGGVEKRWFSGEDHNMICWWNSSIVGKLRKKNYF
jgi:hypothetical protein